MKHFFQLLVLGLTLTFPAIVSAVPITWSANGHRYEAVFSPTDTHPTWESALAAAAALTLDGASGYLATFTTQEEQEFAISNLGGAGFTSNFYGSVDIRIPAALSLTADGTGSLARRG